MRSTPRAIIAVFLGLCVIVSSSGASGLGRSEVRTSVLSVTPPFGATPRNLAVVLTPRELLVTSRITREIQDLQSFTPQTLRLITWYVEPNSVDSPTIALARTVLIASQQIFETFNIFDGQATSIVIGRTQQFLNNTVSALGCFPNLSRTFGQHLMGAALCNDRVIVVNLSGYLFLESLRPVTAADEIRAEPPLERRSYLLIERDATVLAHEWAHSVRTLIAGGRVPDGEPTWMSEGFAEMVDGLAQAKAFAPGLTFTEMHAIVVRLFSNWPTRCRLDVASYRIPAPQLAGCEYVLGFLAVELLLANHGGLGKLLELYKSITAYQTFADAFQAIYGMSLEQFEREANDYIREVASLGFCGRFRLQPVGRVSADRSTYCPSL